MKKTLIKLAVLAVTAMAVKQAIDDASRPVCSMYTVNPDKPDAETYNIYPINKGVDIERIAFDAWVNDPMKDTSGVTPDDYANIIRDVNTVDAILTHGGLAVPTAETMVVIKRKEKNADKDTQAPQL